MKEILSLSANFLAAWSDDKKLNHRVEVILITSEPKYGVDLSGELTRQRQTDQYRFTGSPETIRTLGKKLQMLADEAEELPLSNASDDRQLPGSSTLESTQDLNG
jgi:hypothetical protein